MTITVYCNQVKIPAMSTIGYGRGVDDQGRLISFVGDHRAMRYVGAAVEDEGEVPVEIEGYQIVEVEW